MTVLLVVCFVSLGSGALEYLHECQHAAEDAREDHARQAAGLPADTHPHDDSNCPVHAQLHAAIIASTPPVALLVFLGWVAFLNELRPISLPRRVLGCFDCRGPPRLFV